MYFCVFINVCEFSQDKSEFISSLIRENRYEGNLDDDIKSNHLCQKSNSVPKTDVRKVFINFISNKFKCTKK